MDRIIIRLAFRAVLIGIQKSKIIYVARGDAWSSRLDGTWSNCIPRDAGATQLVVCPKCTLVSMYTKGIQQAQAGLLTLYLKLLLSLSKYFGGCIEGHVANLVGKIALQESHYPCCFGSEFLR